MNWVIFLEGEKCNVTTTYDAYWKQKVPALKEICKTSLIYAGSRI